jgi:hypothetical protein
MNPDGQTTKKLTTKRSLPQAHKQFQCCPAKMQTKPEKDNNNFKNEKNKREKIGKKENSEVYTPKIDTSDRKNSKNIEKTQSKKNLLNIASNKNQNARKKEIKGKDKSNHEKSIFEIKNYIWW